MVAIFNPERLTEAQEQTRAGWQYRALLAAGNHSPYHFMMLVHALGGHPKSPPWVIGQPRINIEGKIIATMMAPSRVIRKDVFLCTTIQFRDDFRKIADVAQLSDDDRRELFADLRGWFGKDDRVKVDLK